MHIPDVMQRNCSLEQAPSFTAQLSSSEASSQSSCLSQTVLTKATIIIFKSEFKNLTLVGRTAVDLRIGIGRHGIAPEGSVWGLRLWRRSNRCRHRRANKPDTSMIAYYRCFYYRCFVFIKAAERDICLPECSDRCRK